jgi:serine/threonine-protein kinase
MSPEQARGRTVDGRADIYATGLILYELLTGERAFQADHPLEVMRMHCEDAPPPLARGGSSPAFSAALEQAVATALAKDPDDRFASPGDFAETLAEVPEATGASIERSRTRSSDPAPDDAAGNATLATVLATGGRPLTPPLPVPVATTSETPPPISPRRGKRRSRRSLVALALGAAMVVGGAWLVTRTDWIERAAGWRVGDFLDELSPGKDQDSSVAVEPPPTLEAAEALRAEGKLDRAIQLVHEIRRARPADARASYLLGELYHVKGWSAEALAAWAEAADKQESFRKRPALVRHFIDALGDSSTRGKARAILLRRLGKAAIPELRRAADRHPNPDVRRESRNVLDQLTRR